MLTQVEIGNHLFMDQSTVSRMCDALKIDWQTSTIDEVRIAYIRHLREMAETRAAAGWLDLAAERAALAKAQRERIEMQNEITRRELAPVVLIEEVLAKVGNRVACILDTIPGMIKHQVAGLSSSDIELIAGEVARARNIAASISITDVGEDCEDEFAENIAADGEGGGAEDECRLSGAGVIDETP